MCCALLHSRGNLHTNSTFPWAGLGGQQHATYINPATKTRKHFEWGAPVLPNWYLLELNPQRWLMIDVLASHLVLACLLRQLLQWPLLSCSTSALSKKEHYKNFHKPLCHFVPWLQTIISYTMYNCICSLVMTNSYRTGKFLRIPTNHTALTGRSYPMLTQSQVSSSEHNYPDLGNAAGGWQNCKPCHKFSQTVLHYSSITKSIKQVRLQISLIKQVARLNQYCHSVYPWYN